MKLIKTPEEYTRALAELALLMDTDPPKDSAEGDRLELLAHLIGVYEVEAFPFELPDAISAIRFRMEEQGLSQKDLIPYIGSKSKVSEVLSGKRPLTLGMIRKLHEGLTLPLEVLIKEK